MNLQNAYNHIKDALQADWMSDLHIEQLDARPVHCDHQQAWSEIKAFQPTQGWIQTLDEVYLIEKGHMPDSQDPLISAELVNEAQESLHIRPSNKGILSLVHFIPNQGATYFVTESRHQIKHRSKIAGNSVYKLYWSTDQANTQPALSRFIGFNLVEK